MTFYERRVRGVCESHLEPMIDERGFLTLQDDIEVFHQMSEFYNPEAARGVRWDGPGSQIALPEKMDGTSARDRTHPNFE